MIGEGLRIGSFGASAHNDAMTRAAAIDRPGHKSGAGRRLLIWGPAALGAGLVALHGESCHALAVEA